MKKPQKPKAKIKLYVSRFLNVMVFVLIIGIFIGAGTFKLIHNCRVETVEAMNLVTEESASEQNTEDIALQEEKEQEPESTLRSLGTFTITAYCACYDCCEKLPSHPDYGITATGTKATEGRTVAVDPLVIPYGTEVIVDGHTYVAEDCGSAIKGNRLDIFFESHTEAKQFGVQNKEVFVR